MKIRVIRLGTVCKDSATELKGTLTHWLIDMDGHIDYLFQPEGLNEEEQPLKKHFVGPTRLNVQDSDYQEVEVPMEILGTKLTNKPSGFKGIAVQFVYHINGCFHVAIQPPGISQKTKQVINKAEFDLRECVGEMNPALSAPELKRSKEDNPSPDGDSHERVLPGCVG